MPYHSKGIRGQWSDLSMKQAVNAVLVNGVSNVKAAKQHSVPLETLRRKVTKARRGEGVDKKLGRPTVLGDDMEEELTRILTDMEARLYGLSPADVRRVVYKYCDRNGIANNFNTTTEMAGRYWLDGFLKRHPELSIRQAEAISIQRAIGFNKPKVDKFYQVLKGQLFNEMGECLIPPSNIYNVDESGYTVCQRTGKILAKKGKHNVGQVTSAEKGKTVTAVCCMSAAGVFVPPMLIFPRARLKPSLMDSAPTGAIGEANKSGWITEAIFTKWFMHFISMVQPQNRPQPMLLLMDGHSSHTGNLDVIELASAHNVHLIVFPSHCTHRLQPLDLTFFKSLNSCYDAEVVAWLRSHPGRCVTEEQIGGLFASAYGKAANVNNATKGFSKAGIYPFRDDLFTEDDFAGSAMTDRDQATSGPESTSVSTAEAVSDLQMTVEASCGPESTSVSIIEAASDLQMTVEASCCTESTSVSTTEAASDLQMTVEASCGPESTSVSTTEAASDLQMTVEASCCTESTSVSTAEAVSDLQMTVEASNCHVSTSVSVAEVHNGAKRKLSFREFIAVPTQALSAQSRSNRKRKVGHACVLTASPYKRTLSESKQLKLENEQKKVERKAIREKKKLEKEVAKHVKSTEGSDSPKRKKHLKTKASETRGHSSSKSGSHRSTLKHSATTDDCECLYCGGLYSESVEDFVQCQGICAKWAHVGCAIVDGGHFVCEHCE